MYNKKIFLTFLSFLTFLLSSDPPKATETEDNFKDKYVIIRIWNNTWANPDEAGHVSLETEKKYVSLWPDKSDPAVQSSKRQIVTARGLFADTYKQDLDNEQKYPSDVFVLKTLNTKNIEQSFEEIYNVYYVNHKLVWTIDSFGQITDGILHHNCTSIVRYLLQRGEIDLLFSDLSVRNKNRDTEQNNTSFLESKQNGKKFTKVLLPTVTATYNSDKTAEFAIILLTKKNINSRPDVRKYLFTYFSEDLSFYTPHQLKPVLMMASLLEEALDPSKSNANPETELSKIKHQSRDYVAQFNQNGSIKFFKKRSLDSQEKIDRNREFDKTFWSWFSPNSWLRWASDEQSEDTAIIPQLT